MSGGGAGFYPAGGTPGGPLEFAGEDPDYVPSPQLATDVVAILFDPSTRQFVQNADGTFAPVHPIDQQVALLLWLQQGNIPSSPTTGNRIRARIRRVDPTTIPAIVTDEVTSALQPLITNGDIRLEAPSGVSSAIVVDTSVKGATKIAVYYRNLRLPGSKLRKANP